MPSLTTQHEAEIQGKPEEQQLPYYVKACALGITAYLIGIHLWTWVFTARFFLAGRADFRAMYIAGYLVRTGQRKHLYEYALQARLQDLIVGPSDTPLPFNHLAYESLLFAPLSMFKYPTAYSIFLLTNLLFLAICFAVLRPWTRNLSKVYKWFPVALVAAFLPIAAALIQGQDSILLLLIFAGSFALLERHKDSLAGTLAGLSMFKFQLALPIALIYLLWRKWKFAAGFAAMSLFVLSVSAWLVGFAQIKTYSHLLTTMSSSTPASFLRNVFTANQMPNLRGLIFGLAYGLLPTSFVSIVTAISSATLLLWAATSQHLRTSVYAPIVAITLAVLVSYHLNFHDLSLMLVPILWALDQFIFSEAGGRRSHVWVVRSAALAFCAPVAESFFPQHLYLIAVPMLIFFVLLLRSSATEEISAHSPVL